MTQRLFSILLAAYFLLGNTLLPIGDFSTLTHLPQMYKHCLHEDIDMTPFDFITDHLINIDGVFDKHEDGDQQKSHEAVPFQKTTHDVTPSISLTVTEVAPVKVFIILKKIRVFKENRFSQDFAASIFRPPIG